MFPLQLHYGDADARHDEPEDVVVGHRVAEGAAPDGALDEARLAEGAERFEGSPDSSDVPGHEDGPQQQFKASKH